MCAGVEATTEGLETTETNPSHFFMRCWVDKSDRLYYSGIHSAFILRATIDLPVLGTTIGALFSFAKATEGGTSLSCSLPACRP